MARTRQKLKPVSALGEDALVTLLTSGLPQTARTLHGPGDDCAVLSGPDRKRLTLFKTDALVQDIHFTLDMDAAGVGWKALCRCISDVASMGGEPAEALITLAMPRSTPLAWVQRLYAGIKKAARRYECGIAGGETSSTPDGAPIVISVSMLGSVERKCLKLRSGARVDDWIYVTGRLGGSLAGRHLKFPPRLAEARWLVKNANVGAMMDLSDGLAKDLPRLARASGKGYYLILCDLPRTPGCTYEAALGDGEDYELLFTARMGFPYDIYPAWRAAFPGTKLTAIGQITEESYGYRPGFGEAGWDHFKPKP